MNNIIIGLSMYNEEDRFLEDCLKNMRKITDKLVVMDDGSTDNSYAIAAKYATEMYSSERLYKKSEALLRNQLWVECCKMAEEGDFIFINDCDEIFTLSSTAHFAEEMDKANYYDADAMGFERYDMWSEKLYRRDQMWNSGISYVRCVRYKKNYTYYWNQMKLHCGSIPVNAYFNFYPTKLQILHWAYSTPELRRQKYNFYKEYDPDCIWGNKTKYESILDENPLLFPLRDNYRVTE